MRKIYSYYMTQRPPQIGAMPKEGLLRIVYLNDEEMREWVDTLRAEAYARLEYDHELTQKEIKDYELIPDLYNLQMCRDSVLWLCEQLKNTNYMDVYERRRAQMMIKYLHLTISYSED